MALQALVKPHSINALQVIRAMAALSVLLYHLDITMKTQLNYGLMHTITNSFGIAGVEVFFVLSGFIIYMTSINKITSLSVKEFLLRRFVRIFPIYWVALIATLCIFLLMKYTVSTPSTFVSTIETGGWRSLLASLFLIPNDPRVIDVSWTLSFEIAFYLLFAALFFRKPRSFMYVLAAWVLLCYINIFFFHIDFSDDHINSNPMKALLNPIVIEFFFGCLVASLFIKYPGKYSTFVLTLGGSLLIGSSILVRFFTFPEHVVVLLFGIPASLIIYGAANIKANIPRLLIFLGDASYSIYLFHTLLISVLIKIVFTLHLSRYIGNVGGVFLLSLLTTLVCCGIYTYIENPLLIYSKKKIDAYKQAALGTNSTPLLLQKSSN